MFASLAQTLARIMLLRAGPQDLPAAPGILQLSVLLYMLSAIGKLLLINPFLAALAQALLSVVVLWAYLRAILNMRKIPERFAQTFAALLLTSAIIGTLMLGPLSALTPMLLQIAEGGDMQALQVPAMAAYAWLGLSLWGLTLAGHIFRHALDTSLGVGVLVALGYEVMLIFAVSIVAAPTAA